MDLKRHRLAKGLTQAETAKMVGVTPSSYAMYERGEREPNIETLKKMCNVFGVDLPTLVGIIPVKNSTDEDKLIALFRQLPPESQEKAVALIEATLRATNLID
jgi:transcriptional regulator with XRE-family HTH domain